MFYFPHQARPAYIIDIFLQGYHFRIVLALSVVSLLLHVQPALNQQSIPAQGGPVTLKTIHSHN